MSMNIFIPVINPLHFTVDGFSPVDQYRSKHIDDYQLEDTIRDWQQEVEWLQTWQKSDAIRLQFHSQIADIEYKLINEYGNTVLSGSFQQMQQSHFDPTLYIYQLDLSLGIVNPGLYYLRVDFGSPVTVTLFSNRFLVDQRYEDSLLIEYKHFRHYADAYFENGWNPNIRLISTLVFSKPGSSNTVYDNQELDTTLLDAKPYDIWKFYAGGPDGIPDWLIKKLNIIFGCSDLKIDGRFYTKSTEGSNFDERGQEDYPMRGWSIELRDKLNRRSKVITTGGLGPGQNNLGLTVVVNVESKGFVNDDVGGSYYEVQDIE